MIICLNLVPYRYFIHVIVCQCKLTFAVFSTFLSLQWLGRHPVLSSFCMSSLPVWHAQLLIVSTLLCVCYQLMLRVKSCHTLQDAGCWCVALTVYHSFSIGMKTHLSKQCHWFATAGIFSAAACKMHHRHHNMQQLSHYWLLKAAFMWAFWKQWKMFHHKFSKFCKRVSQLTPQLLQILYSACASYEMCLVTWLLQPAAMWNSASVFV